MTPEDLRLSAEMCGHSTEIILPEGVFLISPVTVLWQPHKNPAQWQECILKLLELGWDTDFGGTAGGYNEIQNLETEIVFECSPLEFPVLALAELKRRMK